ncbi:NAD(P)/FAD-dependent oxidoreductase [Natrialbaceae archaeon A-CW2]
MTQTPTVAVVGGGLAGLVTARHLAAGGLEVTLYERAAEVGGRVRTTVEDGFRFDRGFQVLFTAYPAVRAELDLEALDLKPFSPGAVIARDGHRSTLADPLREPRALPATLLNRDVTIGDKLAVLKLRRNLASRDLESIFPFSSADGGRSVAEATSSESGAREGETDTSIESYLRESGFSDRFIDRFAAPFYGGITLDRSLSTSSRVFEYTFRTLSEGSIAVPANGMGAIPAQLAANARRAGAQIELETTVTAVTGTDDGRVELTLERGDETTTDTQSFDAAVVATDPPTASELTGLESIPTDGPGCVTQYYRLPAGTTLDTGKRLLLNAADDDGPNHVTPHTDVTPSYAPEDASLVSATYLGDLETDAAQLRERTRAALQSWYPERRFDDLEMLHTARIPFAQFAQPPGVHETLPDPRDPGDSVYLAGDYTRWSSIQGALESGRQAAKAVLEDVSR